MYRLTRNEALISRHRSMLHSFRIRVVLSIICDTRIWSAIVSPIALRMQFAAIEINCRRYFLIPRVLLLWCLVLRTVIQTSSSRVR